MKPSEIEDQYVSEFEQSRRLQDLETERQKSAKTEILRLKQLHWMHCPKCGQTLLTKNHGPVEVDLCPSCRGVWLDANELETIEESERHLFGSWLKLLQGRGDRAQTQATMADSRP